MNPISLPRHKRGAALVFALIFIAGIAVLTMSALSVARQDARISSVNADRNDVEIAISGGFEEAKALLLQAISDEDYVVSSYLADPDDPLSKDITARSRYTFVSKVTGDSAGGYSIEHQPLVAGAKKQVTPIQGDLHTQSLKPQLRADELFDPTYPDRAEVINGPELTHYEVNAAGTYQVPKEKRSVETRWIPALGSVGNNKEARCTFWIEDLEGYPNLDVVGMPSATSGQLAQTWTGYGPYDLRINQSYEPYRGCPTGFALEFPRTLGSGSAVQNLVGLPCAGLSPRELHLLPRKLGNLPVQHHPYWRAPVLRLNDWALVSGNGATMLAQFPDALVERSRFANNLEDRFVSGLRPYRELELIPRGFGYVDEGRRKTNLNRLVNSASPKLATARSVEVDAIAKTINDNLPNFTQRKGAFPEDYVKTLAATIIDYADEDPHPTVSAAQPPYGSAESTAYRGLDSMPVVNECFVRLKIEAIEGSHPNYTIRFSLTPFMEFWNSGNQEITGARLGLRLVFLKRLAVYVADFPPPAQPARPVIASPVLPSQIGADPNSLPPGATDQGYPIGPKAGLVDLYPNEHKVVEFADYQLQTQVTMKTATRLTISDIKINNRSGQMAEFQYQIYQDVSDGQVTPLWVKIDQAGRPNAFDQYRMPVDDKSKEYSLKDFKQGFGFNRFCPPAVNFERDYRFAGGGGANLIAGDYMISCTAPGLVTQDASDYSNWGDSRMAYYVGGGQLKPQQYVDWGSPGYRNVRHPDRSKGRYIDEVRLWDTPDRGFACPAPSVSLAGPLMPNDPAIQGASAAVPPEVYAPLAPGRLSGQGRYFSISELGNIYDPVMWKTFSGSMTGVSASWKTKEEQVMNIGPNSQSDQRFGGGNTLRIGRPEHPKFDFLGQRACQLTDLFSVGVPGTPAELQGGSTSYASYDPNHHHPPRSAKDATTANDDDQPYVKVYAKEVHRDAVGNLLPGYAHDHAESPFRSVNGRINLNSAPTLFEIETFLNGAFGTSAVSWENAGPGANSQSAPGAFDLIAAGDTTRQASNGLNTDPSAKDGMNRPKKTIADVARILYESRPYLSPSDLAYEVARAIGPGAGKGDALPHHHSDAMAEEICARVLNAATLRSRHFRIRVCSEVRTKRLQTSTGFVLTEGGEVVSRTNRVYDVFVRAHRDMNPASSTYGDILSNHVEVLQVRDL